MSGIIGKLLFSGKKETYRCSAVIVAAGESRRMRGVDKLTASIGGEKVIIQTLKTFDNSECIDEIILVVNSKRLEEMSDLVATAGLRKLTKVIAGGDTRMESSLAGINAVGDRAKLVAIHDGARPLVTEKLIERCVKAASKISAVIPAVPVNDTLKTISDGIVTGSVDRNSTAAVQTPQVFDIDLIKAALTKAMSDKKELTDDSSAVEFIGGRVGVVEGDRDNIKITTPVDLLIANVIMEARNNENRSRV